MNITTLRTYQDEFTAAELTSNNPLLQRGELVQESDTGRAKLGNGSTDWAGLMYLDSGGGGVGAPTNAQYLVLTLDGTLTDERRFVPSSPITGTDAGAGSTYTVGFDQTVDLNNNARVGVRKDSAGSTYKRRRINLIAGTGVSITIADDSGDEEVDITITASGTDSRLQATVLAGDVTDNSGALTNLTGFYVSLDAGKVYIVRALVRFKTDSATAGAAFSLRGPNPGLGPARTQELHTMVPVSVSSIVDRLSNTVGESGTLTTSDTISSSGTYFLAELVALVKTDSSSGPGQYFLAYHSDGAAVITIGEGTAMYAIEAGAFP